MSRTQSRKVVPMSEHNGRVTAKKNGTGNATPRLCLVKVLVQPVFVLVDDNGVSEVQANPVEVKAADWQEWAATAFTAEAIAQLQASMQPTQQATPHPVKETSQ